jgi:hypothetical protein
MVAIAQRLEQTITRQSVRAAVCCWNLQGHLAPGLRELVWVAIGAPVTQQSFAFGRTTDPFSATSPELSSRTPHFSVVDDDADVPMRVIEPSGEVYDGPRGRLVVINKKRR